MGSRQKGAGEMKEHPILFSGEMVRAILAGTKTQTRRIVKLDQEANTVHEWDDGRWEFGKEFDDGSGEMCQLLSCHYGQPGDWLWVRETWQDIDNIHGGLTTLYRADGNSEYTDDFMARMKWQAPIFMPRSRSRLTLEVVSIRVERVQEISEDDVISEGVVLTPKSLKFNELLPALQDHYRSIAKGSYRDLWDRINAKRGYSWESNPWTWVIEFKRIEP
jgi:hypothetical protein